MKIVLEGTVSETDAMLAAIKSAFDVKSVSKFKPNALNSAVDNEGRVYIALKGFRDRDIVDVLAADMLSRLEKRGLMGDAGMLDKVRQFHEAGKRGIEGDRLAELYIAWRDAMDNI